MSKQNHEPRGTAKRGPLLIFIRKHYRTHRALAESLNVSPQTISNWLHSTPLQMLKHTETIRKGTGVDVVDLTTACLGQLRHIKRIERAKRVKGPKTPPKAQEAVKSP